eukprot:4011303-Amphidinium_carterae.5
MQQTVATNKFFSDALKKLRTQNVAMATHGPVARKMQADLTEARTTKVAVAALEALPVLKDTLSAGVMLCGYVIGLTTDKQTGRNDVEAFRCAQGFLEPLEKLMREVLQEKLLEAKEQRYSAVELEELCKALRTANGIWPDSALDVDAVARQLDAQRRSDTLRSFCEAIQHFCNIGDGDVQESDIDAVLQEFSLVARYKVNEMPIEELSAEMKSVVLKALDTLVHSFTESKIVTSVFLAGLMKIAESGQCCIAFLVPKAWKVSVSQERCGETGVECHSYMAYSNKIGIAIFVVAQAANQK